MLRPASLLRWSLPLALLLTATIHAADDPSKLADWPRFRGPKLNNLSPDKGLLKKWPKDGPPVVWKATKIGSGYSSITVAGDRVFTLGNRNDKTFIVALNRKDGEELWTAEVGSAGNDLGCTPTVDGDRVYAIGQRGDLVCAAVADGKVKWRKNFIKDFKGHCGSWSYTESPLVDGDKLVCTPGAKDALMVALDKKTGNLIWKCAAPVRDSTAGYSSPVIATVGGVRLYVQLAACGVIGVRAKDGKFLWVYDKLGNNTANIPTPTVLGDEVLCAAGYGKGAALLKLSADGDKVTAKEVYYNRQMRNRHGGLVVVGDYVYGDTDHDGRPFCAEVKTGKVKWKKGRGQGSGSAAVTYADGHLYFLYQNGIMALVKATPDAYEEISAFKVPNPQGNSWAHPVVVGGRLYLRQGNTLWCYDVKEK